MKLELERRYKKEMYTVGRLYIDGVRFCDTLEDKDRGLTSTMTAALVRNLKVPGETAIPTGTYSVTLSVVSPKFSKVAAYSFCGGRLPRLLNVPGYDGVLIHIGNTASSSAGCILVGRNRQVGKVLDSTATFRALYARLKTAADAGEKIEITIR